MMPPEPSIRVDVDLTNPGQFFACCGLLELADRLGGEARGWFEGGEFLIKADVGLPDLIGTCARAELEQLDRADNTASPIRLGTPFRPLRLDWWRDDRSGGKELKVWAGTMESFRIARAMQHAIKADRFTVAGLFDVGVVVHDPTDPGKKVEPFYFDARRAPNAHSRDVGFSPNDLHFTTTAFPAVEFFCLVGLQRCLPAKTDRPRVFAYHPWSKPLLPSLIAPAASGLLDDRRTGYCFENWYRTGQRKHKAFRSATPLLDLKANHERPSPIRPLSER